MAAALAAAADDLVGAPSQLGAVVPPLPDAEQEDQDRAAVRTLDPEVQGMIDEDDPGASETTSVFENRLGGLMTRLEDAGHEPNVVRAAGVAEAMARRWCRRRRGRRKATHRQTVIATDMARLRKKQKRRHMRNQQLKSSRQILKRLRL